MQREPPNNYRKKKIVKSLVLMVGGGGWGVLWEQQIKVTQLKYADHISYIPAVLI